MKSLFIGSFLLGGMVVLCLQTGCTRLNSQSPSHRQSWEIAELLNRNEHLGSVEEQQVVSRQYHTLKYQILRQSDDWKSYIQLSRLFMIEARVTGEHGYYYPAALSLLDRTLEYASEHDIQFQASFLKASVLLSLHRFEEALRYGEKALSLNPYHALTYGTLVDAHVELGNYEDAVVWVEKMVNLRPDLRSYARISYLRELKGDIKGAVDAMEMAIEAGVPGQEDRAWCRTTLGDLHLKYGNLPAAENQFQWALHERSNYPFALAGLAKLSQLQGANKEALQLLDSAALLIPELSFFIQKAKLVKDLEEPTQLTMLQTSILEMFDDDEEKGHLMYAERAKYFRDVLGDDSAFFAYTQIALSERPRNKEVAHLAAGMYYRKGVFDLAREYAEISVQGGCKDPEYIGLLGLILVKEGNLKEGTDYIKYALETNPFQAYFFTKELKTFLDKSVKTKKA